ncbi:MAG TPA: phosphatase PAP2 family protein, partial [Rhizobacter sp.]|nr:phosphatase PAP2 family protein [Rhizobacter sp.]
MTPQWQGFVVAAVLVIGGVWLHRTPMDTAAFLSLNAVSPVLGLGAAWFAVAGLGATAVVISGALGLRQPAIPAAVLIAVIFGGLLVQLIKTLVGAPRPLAALGPEAVHIVGAALQARSMPSGHSAMGAVLAAMAWAAPPSLHRPRLRCAANWLLTLFGLLCALSRAVVGVHWPSDILVGVGIGLAAGVLVAGTAGGRAATRRLAAAMVGKLGSCIFAVLLVAVAWSIWSARREYPSALWLSAALALLGAAAGVGWWTLHPGLLGRLAKWPGFKSPSGVRVVWRFALVAAITAAVLAVVYFAAPHAHETFGRAARLGLAGWLLAACGMFVSYAFRAARLHAEWRVRRQLDPAHCLRVTLLHNAAVNVLPMRSGELGYPLMLYRQWQIPLADSASSLAWMRLQDMIVIAWLGSLAAVAALWSQGLIALPLMVLAAAASTVLFLITAARAGSWGAALVTRWGGATQRLQRWPRVQRIADQLLAAAAQGSSRTQLATWLW